MGATIESAVAWAKQLHNELDHNVKKLNETRLPETEALTTIKDEQEKLEKAFLRVARLGTSYYVFKDMVFKQSIVTLFFQTSSVALRGLQPEEQAILRMVKVYKVCQLSRPLNPTRLIGLY